MGGDKNGRVMSFYAVSFLGVMPFGSLLAGSIAGKIGVQNTLLLGAGCCMAGALIFASKLSKLVELLRPVFTRLESCGIDGQQKTARVSPEIH